MTETQKQKLIVIGVIALIMTPLWVMLLGPMGIYIAIFWAVVRGMMALREDDNPNEPPG